MMRLSRTLRHVWSGKAKGESLAITASVGSTPIPNTRSISSTIPDCISSGHSPLPNASVADKRADKTFESRKTFASTVPTGGLRIYERNPEFNDLDASTLSHTRTLFTAGAVGQSCGTFLLLASLIQGLNIVEFMGVSTELGSLALMITGNPFLDNSVHFLPSLFMVSVFQLYRGLKRYRKEVSKQQFRAVKSMDLKPSMEISEVDLNTLGTSVSDKALRNEKFESIRNNLSLRSQKRKAAELQLAKLRESAESQSANLRGSAESQSAELQDDPVKEQPDEIVLLCEGDTWKTETVVDMATTTNELPQNAARIRLAAHFAALHFQKEEEGAVRNVSFLEQLIKNGCVVSQKVARLEQEDQLSTRTDQSNAPTGNAPTRATKKWSKPRVTKFPLHIRALEPEKKYLSPAFGSPGNELLSEARLTCLKAVILLIIGSLSFNYYLQRGDKLAEKATLQCTVGSGCDELEGSRIVEEFEAQNEGNDPIVDELANSEHDKKSVYF